MSKYRSKEHIKAQKAGKRRDKGICQICGSMDHVEGHHILDVFFGGAAHSDNIVSLCHKHHKDVHNGLIDLLRF